MSVYGLPSGSSAARDSPCSPLILKGLGIQRETKPMLNTSHGLYPGMIFTIRNCRKRMVKSTDAGFSAMPIIRPRVARIDLSTFRTAEIIELPNSAGNHSSPFITENTEYVVAGTRFSVPPDDANGDVPINTYNQNFKGTISFISVGKEDGKMDIAFQLLCPGVNFDLSHAGKVNRTDGSSSPAIIRNRPTHCSEVNASQKR